MGQLSESTHELTRVPPDEFVAARDALARRLRGEGRREEAAAVARLRRPSPSLWAVNQLAETDPERLVEVIEAATAVREGTEAALRGRRVDLAGLSARHGRAVEELTSRAMVVLAAAGRPAAGDTRSRAWSIIRAASTDPETAPLLRDGALMTEPKSSGFDGMEGFALGELAVRERPRPVERPARETVAEPAESDDTAQAERERERAERLRVAAEDVDARSRRLNELKEEVVRARERVQDVHAELARAEREERRLVRAADEAERELGAARKALDRLGG